MSKFFSPTRIFWRDESGVTAVEYGLIAALIAVAIIATVYLVGQSLNDFFLKLKDCIATPSTCAG